MINDSPTLVNAVLGLSATVEKMTQRLDRMTLMLQPLLNTAEELNQHFVHELRAKLEKQVAEQIKTNEKLSALSKDVGDVEREVTGSHRPYQAKDDPPHNATMLAMFLSQPGWFKALVVSIVPLAVGVGIVVAKAWLTK